MIKYLHGTANHYFAYGDDLKNAKLLLCQKIIVPFASEQKCMCVCVHVVVCGTYLHVQVKAKD